MLHRENRRPPHHQMLAPNLLGRHLADQQNGWWATEMISGNWGQASPHWGRSWLSSCHRKPGKKPGESPQPPGETKPELLLNTNTRTECWRNNTRITKTEILLFLILEFFCFLVFCLFCSLIVCPPLPVDFFVIFFLFLCFVSFIIVS
jgi:hypothetical protein